MKKVAKLLMVDPQGNYLLMYRSNHPTFGNDPDLPGGTVEDGETLLDAAIREVKEESGVDIDTNITELYSGTDYSKHGTHYALFLKELTTRPEVTVSWEHQSYEWLPKESFLKRIKDSDDSYMNMVYEVLY